MANAWLRALVEATTDASTAVPDEHGAHYVTVAVDDQRRAKVRLRVTPDLHVTAVSPLAWHVQLSAELLASLNGLNAQRADVTLVWAEGALWAQGRHPALTLDRSEFAHLVETVASSAVAGYEVLKESRELDSALLHASDTDSTHPGSEAPDPEAWEDDGPGDGSPAPDEENAAALEALPLPPLTLATHDPALALSA